MAEDPQRPGEEELMDFIAGRSSADAAAAVESAARLDPALAAEIAVMRATREAMRAGAAENTPGALGWARLSRAIDADIRAPAPKRRFAYWQVAAAAAVAAVAVWQTIAVPLLPGPGGGYVAATGPTAGGPSASVAFAAGATEAEIRSLLLEVGASVTGGPSAIGLWQVTFDSESARATGLAKLLSRPGIVESAQAD